MSRRVPRLLLLFLLAVAGLAMPRLAPPARAADIAVIAHPMVMPVLAELRVRFERQSGHKLLNSANRAGGPRGLLQRGEGFDVALLPAPLVREFAPRGAFAPDDAVTLLRAPVAVAVRSGTPKPDISTPQALRARLLVVKSFSYAPGGEAGPHMEKVIGELGITEAVRGKAKTPPALRQAIQAVASGERSCSSASRP
jgi:molybdate transport system substrate-binding protein